VERGGNRTSVRSGQPRPIDKAASASGRQREGTDNVPLRHELRPRGPVRFAITEAQHNDAVSLEIVGELDLLTAPRFAAKLNSVVRQSDRDVVVDLRQAEFLDSAGLQVLLGVQRRLSNDARKLSVVCEEGPVRRVIELARLGETLGLVALS
jgi:anti-sigma B factor antagonist